MYGKYLLSDGYIFGKEKYIDTYMLNTSCIIIIIIYIVYAFKGVWFKFIRFGRDYA